MPPEKAPALPIDSSELVLEEDLEPTIKTILEGKYESLVTEEEMRAVQRAVFIENEDGEFEPSVKGRADALELWRKIKAERNAYVAIFASEVWNDPAFAKNREEAVDSNAPIHTKLEHAKDLFFAAINNWFVHQKGLGEAAPLAPQLARFERLIDFNDYAIMDGRPPEHVKRGVQTAYLTTSGLVAAIQEQAAERGLPLTKALLEQIAERAFYKIGVILASTNVAVGPEIIDKGFHTPGMFSLREEKDGSYTLLMDPKVLLTVTDDKGRSIWGARSGKTTRCPALYKVAGRSPVISEYFKWMLEIIRSTADKK